MYNSSSSVNNRVMLIVNRFAFCEAEKVSIENVVVYLERRCIRSTKKTTHSDGESCT